MNKTKFWTKFKNDFLKIICFRSGCVCKKIVQKQDILSLFLDKIP